MSPNRSFDVLTDNVESLYLTKRDIASQLGDDFLASDNYGLFEKCATVLDELANELETLVREQLAPLLADFDDTVDAVDPDDLDYLELLHDLEDGMHPTHVKILSAIRMLASFD